MTEVEEIKGMLESVPVVPPKSNVIQVDFFNKCKRKPVYPMIIKPKFGEDNQD